MTEYMVVSRTVTMAAPPERIIPEIVDLHRWRSWSPWEDLDPELTRAYDGPQSGVGAGYDWSGNRKAGAGRMQVTAVSPDAVSLDVTFTRPFKSESRAEFQLVPGPHGTTVTWQMLTPKTLLTRLFGLFMNLDKTVGPDLETGLQRLSEVSART